MDSSKHSLQDFLHTKSDDLFQKAFDFQRFILDARDKGHETYLFPIKSYHGSKATVDNNGRDHEVVIFCSADYLGYARHQAVKQAAQSAINTYGLSVTSVPLIAGSTDAHTELKERLIEFTGFDDVVIFPTGHAANIGVISALCHPSDTVIFDKMIHQSILEGIYVSKASWHTFRHSDMKSLESILKKTRSLKPNNGILVVIEGVYGIDGDIAPLPQILDLIRKYNAKLVIDDAHALGVIGKSGGGLIDYYNVTDLEDIVLMGSLSKSLGSMGGFIASNKSVVDYLRYYARTIVFSVGLSAIHAAAASKSIDMLYSQENLMKLSSNTKNFYSILSKHSIAPTAESDSSIVSVAINDEKKLRSVMKRLFDNGVWAEGLPYPAVPKGNERIRFRISALHSNEDLEFAVSKLSEALQ